MQIIPAIDLRRGKVVRLLQGRFDQEIIYGEDPGEFARIYEAHGAQWIHVVDLEGALEGRISNLDGLQKIRESTKVNIEFGGGVRTQDLIKELVARGVNRVVLGTKGLEPKFLRDCVGQHGEQIAVSMDLKRDLLLTEGWSKAHESNAELFLKNLESAGLRYVIYTDITRDGMMEGPDKEGLKRILSLTRLQVILSGGVSSLEDLRLLAEVREANFHAVIVGRALYENRFSLKEAFSVIGGSHVE